MSPDVTTLRCFAFIACLLVPSTNWAQALDFATAVTQARQGTVGILKRAPSSSTDPGQRGFSVKGSGVYLGDGYILTSRHVTQRHEGGNTVDPPHVSLISGELEEVTASLVGVNQFLDVAVYRMAQPAIPRSLSARTFGQAEALPGERVFTVGYPLGWGPAISYGTIGNPQTFLQTVPARLVQVDLSVCSGNSGGGLFNAEGEIVGVIHAIIQTETTQEERRCSRFAFAVPGPVVHKIVTALKDGKPFHFSKLGLQLTTVKINDQWHVAVAKAAGPARRAGFKKGDVLLAVDHHRIQSAGQLKNYLIEHTEPFQQVTIRILRGQKEKLLRVTLGKA